MKKILITGARGMLGQDLCTTFQEDGVKLLPLTHDDLDITDQVMVRQILQMQKPDIIIHAAAYTKVDVAEDEKDLCLSVNAQGTKNIAVEAQEIGAVLVYVSTDYVFDGRRETLYREDDEVSPLNVYGESKLAGETFTRAHLAKHFIVRVSWLYGHGGSNFVKSIMAKAKRGKSLNVVDDQYGVPAFTADVAGALKRLLKTKAYGTYHMVSQGVCSWHAFAQEILRLNEWKNELNPIMTGQAERKAKRPKYSAMSIEKLQALLGQEVMPTWQEGLKRYLQLSK
jgi:dTDP-4-dehydrorhamnose reductase